MLTLALLVLAPPPDTAGAAHARQTAYARVAFAQTLAADPELVRATRLKNASPETAEEIARKDHEWIARPGFPLRKELTKNACAGHLRQKTAADPVVVEAMLMDSRGALVCASVETTDYNQGDEAKWKETYAEGSAIFVDEPSLDASAGLFAVQLSVPVSEAGKRIGALTLTLKVPKPAQ